MRRGFSLIVIIGLTLMALVVGVYFFSNRVESDAPQSGDKSNQSKNSTTQKEEKSYQTKKTTTPNNTSNWIYFGSELYKYSLKYPRDFKIVVGNKNVFQATSKDFVEKEGIVTTGAITQVIASDLGDSFESAWGDIETKLKNLDIKVLSKESVLVDGQKSYKLKLQNTDDTTEFRYLTFKNSYAYKISIVIAQKSANGADDYEQILDDIISTFNF